MLQIARMIMLAAVLALAACRAAPTLQTETPAAFSTTTPSATTPNAPATPDVPDTAPVTLEIWLPPEFDPSASGPAGQLLAERLLLLEGERPGTQVRVRIKAASGPGGMLNSLANAANVAPGVLPNLVALRRDDLALAAAAGLVLPLEERVAAATLDDFYPYAQEMGRVNNTWMGLPFAGDARVMVYQTGQYATPPLAFADIVTGTFIMPASETSGLTMLAMYRSLGGSLANAQGELALDPTVLARLLTLLQGMQNAGVLPLNTLDYADPGATWQVFRERRASLAVTSAQWYLLESTRVDGAAGALLPTDGETHVVLADGWSWAIVNTRPERLARTAELLAWLIDPQWQAAWTETAAVLPARRATLVGWQSRRLTPFVNDVVTHALLQPSAQVLAVLGPPLRVALAETLNGNATPQAAALQAANVVNPP